MGGRGGKNKNGKYPTLPVVRVTIYFFNGIEEIRYNEWISFGDLDYTAYFEVDKWGTKHYYTQGGLGPIEGDRRVVGEITAKFASVNLLGQAMGQYYRIEAKIISKTPVYVNVAYPPWALALDDEPEASEHDG